MRKDRFFTTAMAVPLADAGDERERASSGRLRGYARKLAARVRPWIDRYRAQAIYHRLSSLSDAELQRRGLARETLAWHVDALSDGTAKPERRGDGRAHADVSR